jgi:hypothetical protein
LNLTNSIIVGGNNCSSDYFSHVICSNTYFSQQSMTAVLGGSVVVWRSEDYADQQLVLEKSRGTLPARIHFKSKYQGKPQDIIDLPMNGTVIEIKEMLVFQSVGSDYLHFYADVRTSRAGSDSEDREEKQEVWTYVNIDNLIDMELLKKWYFENRNEHQRCQPYSYSLDWINTQVPPVCSRIMS